MSKALRSSSVICIRASISTWKRWKTIRILVTYRWHLEDNAWINLTVNKFYILLPLEMRLNISRDPKIPGSYQPMHQSEQKDNKLRTSTGETSIQSKRHCEAMLVKNYIVGENKLYCLLWFLLGSSVQSHSSLRFGCTCNLLYGWSSSLPSSFW